MVGRLPLPAQIPSGQTIPYRKFRVPYAGSNRKIGRGAIVRICVVSSLALHSVLFLSGALLFSPFVLGGARLLS